MTAKADRPRLTNDVIFGLVMEDKDICKSVLEKLLEVKISRLEYPETQQSIAAGLDIKGVRLDVYVEDDKTAYNIEMQTTNVPDLAIRAMHYHSMMEVLSLKRGDDYNNRKKTIVIVICTFDPFRESAWRYTFTGTCACREYPSASFEDGRTTIFFNTEGKVGSVSEDVKQFLRFAKTGVTTENELVASIDDKMTRVLETERGRNAMMLLDIRIDEAEQRGKQRGKKEGLALAVKILNLFNAGMQPSSIAAKVDLPEDEVLKILDSIKQ